MTDMQDALVLAWSDVSEHIQKTVREILDQRRQWDASFFGSLSDEEEDLIWERLQSAIRKQNELFITFEPMLVWAGELADRFTPEGLVLKSGRILSF